MQQRNPVIPHLADYNTVFKQGIVPNDHESHHYYNANNIEFVDNVNHVEPELILIDSAARNWNKNQISDYTLTLKDKIQYVHSIELLDGSVPASGYMINPSNNILHFREDDDTEMIQATVDPGNYSIKDLLEHLTTVINDISPHHYTYQCHCNYNTNKVTISTQNQLFDLIFANGTEVVSDRGQMETLVINPITHRKELQQVTTGDSRNRYIDGSIGKILGFNAINLSGGYRYTGQMVYHLQPYQYLALFVNTENSEDFKKIKAPSPENGADGAFAVVPLNGSCYDFHKINQVVDNTRYIKTFNPPITVSKIKIQFRTIDGHLYDFNGIDHYLLFEIKRAFGHEIIKALHNLT
uniref:DUF5901 domain-containing protein n=1 Tax=viral metagenome TaxID=1070528 RepID=A0A6C0BL07_9ZZZZ